VWNQLFARKSLERLHAEMHDENRLRRVLGPIGLTSLGIGAIIGAGIFVTTGEAAATKAGPAVMLSYVFAGLGCTLAALCYAEFAAMAPVAGSAYTYAYATLGELVAWIIGWDLILEYAMSCGVLAADWTKYFNVWLKVFFRCQVPDYLSNAPFTSTGGFNFELTGAWFSLPAVIIMAVITSVLVIGIRESATTNAILVMIKIGVVLFVIAVGWFYINRDNWTGIPPDYRKPGDVPDLLARNPDIAALLPPGRHMALGGSALLEEHPQILGMLTAKILDELSKHARMDELIKRPDLMRYVPLDDLPKDANGTLPVNDPVFRKHVEQIVESELKKLPSAEEKWGVMGLLGLDTALESIDDRYRSKFMPFGISGILAAAAAVFFAFIGFDSISTHAEEAKKPQRDVPFGILASLVVCTLLYIGVSAVITGMEPYPLIDPDAAVAEAFHRRSLMDNSWSLRVSAGVIATGALAGMTSVILITMLSQARIFLAMARDGLLPQKVFGEVHPRFRTPHVSTMLTGGLLCIITAITPIDLLFNMVNIGTLLAFVIVCASVLLLRISRPSEPRPFRCPFVYVLAPLGILVNLTMMLFLPLDTWLRLIIWLGIGLMIYFLYGRFHSTLWKDINTGKT
jgi:APA family basic amino acid/polyamine antiporter